MDIDISGCYGKGLKLQEYPIGRPVIIEYPIKSHINDYMSVRKFLSVYEKELVDGMWFARISCFKDFPFEQDYFQSWFHLLIYKMYYSHTV